MTFWPWLQKSAKSVPEVLIYRLSGLGVLCLWAPAPPIHRHPSHTRNQTCKAKGLLGRGVALQAFESCNWG